MLPSSINSAHSRRIWEHISNYKDSIVAALRVFFKSKDSRNSIRMSKNTFRETLSSVGVQLSNSDFGELVIQLNPTEDDTIGYCFFFFFFHSKFFG